MGLIIPILICIGAYLLGSISVAWWVAKSKGINLREHGSGNLGATNVGRVLGSRWFLVVFLADFTKGLIPVLVMMAYLQMVFTNQGSAPSSWWQVIAGLSAVLGHVFPCWHGLRGGKAVATTLGVIIGISPWVAAATLGVWLGAWIVGRLGGLRPSAAVGPASIVAAIAAVALQWWWYGLNDPSSANTTLVTLAGLLILWRHRSNLRALLSAKQQPEYHTPPAKGDNKDGQPPTSGT